MSRWAFKRSIGMPSNMWKVLQIRPKKRSENTAPIEPVQAIKPVAPIFSSHEFQSDSDSPLTDTKAPIIPSVYVNLSQIQAIQPYPYGNTQRGGYMIGDEVTLMKASWAMLGYAAKLGNSESQSSKVKLLRDMEKLMHIDAQLVHTLEQAFLQGRAGQVNPQMLGHKLGSWVGTESILLDVIAELMVYIGLAGQTLSSELIVHLAQGIQFLNVSKVRMQHLIQLRQKEISLGKYFNQPQGGYIAFAIPKNHSKVSPALEDYALAILGLEKPFTLKNAAQITQALVLHYAPVNLSSQHVPRPLIRLCSKKVAEAIAAYNLLR